jgi:hypothetical protein
VVALWDIKKKRPTPPRQIEVVMSKVWGREHETEDSTFRQLCADTRRRLQAANCACDIRQLNGTVKLAGL